MSIAKKWMAFARMVGRASGKSCQEVKVEEHKQLDFEGMGGCD